MIVFLNGQFLSAEDATISIFDRGFLYGDGLFETVRVCHGKAFRWRQHDERLRAGAAFLKLNIPYPAEVFSGLAVELIERNALPEAILRLTVTRGVGPRGYSIQGADQPTIAMSLHPSPPLDSDNPPRIRLATASLRVPADDALAVFKSCNKLPQILARTEAEARGADEALLLNTRDEVAEAAASNLFWVAGGVVHTTPLATGVLAGVTRAVVLELCAARGLVARESVTTVASLREAEGVFVTNSSSGISEVIELDGQSLQRSLLVSGLHLAYVELLCRESGLGIAPS